MTGTVSRFVRLKSSKHGC